MGRGASGGLPLNPNLIIHRDFARKNAIYVMASSFPLCCVMFDVISEPASQRYVHCIFSRHASTKARVYALSEVPLARFHVKRVLTPFSPRKGKGRCFLVGGSFRLLPFQETREPWRRSRVAGDSSY
jgi:hypothetical protein